MTIGDKILNMRKARGWSQEEMADRIGVTRQAVSRWESNTAKPDADKIVDICDLFGVSADYLLRDKYAGEGEHDATAEATAVPLKTHPVTSVQILGIVLIISAILIFCALSIMSAVDPWLYSVDGVDYRGIYAYIMANQLWWFVNLDVAILLIGVMLLIGIAPMRWLYQFMVSKLKKMDT